MKTQACMFLHEWSDWVYAVEQSWPPDRLYYIAIAMVVPETKCLQIRTCRRSGCPGREERFVHDLTEEGWEYIYEDRCIQKQSCRRCEKIIQREVHTWVFDYVDDNSCHQEWKCKRCKAYKTESPVIAGIAKIASIATSVFLGPEKHDWREWEYITEESCLQVRVCKRNEKHKEEREIHDWGEWVYTDTGLCEQIRVCKRNPNHREERFVHDWGEGEYMPGDSYSCLYIRKCQRCSSEDRTTKLHNWSEWEYAKDLSSYQISECTDCGQKRERKDPNKIDVQIFHRFTGKVSNIRLDRAMTATEIIRILIDNRFIVPDPDGYTIQFEDGRILNEYESLFETDAENNTTLFIEFRSLNKKIVEFLSSVPNIHDTNMRQALIYSAGLDPKLQDQISVTGSSAQFIPVLVSTLLRYGRLENGRSALEAILMAARDYVGTDRRKYCERLIQELYVNPNL